MSDKRDALEVMMAIKQTMRDAGVDGLIIGWGVDLDREQAYELVDLLLAQKIDKFAEKWKQL